MKLNSIIMDDLENITKEPINWQKLYHSTVLVTGASGMIASYLIYTLLYLNDTKNAGIQVLGLVRNEERAKKHFKSLLDRNDFRIITQDVTEKVEYPSSIDYIIHAASQTGPMQFVDDPVGTIAANTVGTINLLNLARDKKVKGFLFLSTREIYGMNLEGKEYVSENDYGSLNPTLERSCYPESKRISETLCVSYRKQYGIDCKIARIAHTYGPGLLIGDGRVVGDFLYNTVNNQDIIMNSDGSSILGLTYISDTITGLFYVLLNFKEIVYNVSKDDEAITVKELAETLTNLSPERKIKTVFKKLDEDKKSGYLSHKIPLLSSKKAKSEGWTPNMNITDGMKRTIKYLCMEK